MSDRFAVKSGLHRCRAEIALADRRGKLVSDLARFCCSSRSSLDMKTAVGSQSSWSVRESDVMPSAPLRQIRTHRLAPRGRGATPTDTDSASHASGGSRSYRLPCRTHNRASAPTFSGMGVNFKLFPLAAGVSSHCAEPIRVCDGDLPATAHVNVHRSRVWSCSCASRFSAPHRPETSTIDRSPSLSPRIA